MSKADDIFMQASVTALAKAGRAFVRPKVRDGVGSGWGSRHLAKNLEVRSGTGGNIGKGVFASRIFITHYWALYVHDGRAAIHKDHLMIWYVDPRQDPRLRSSGGYPKRVRQVGKFKPGELRRDADAGKIAGFRHNVKGVAPSKFFSNRSGMRGFNKTVVTPIMQTRWKKHLDTRLKNIINIKDEVVITLG